MSENSQPTPQISGPLKGLRVIELGSTVAGPFCARLMADFGADVIKIEQPEGDAVRSMGSRKGGRSLYGASIFRNKRLISVAYHDLGGEAQSGSEVGRLTELLILFTSPNLITAD